MGCDIHPYYEIQQPDGSWQLHNYRAPYELSRDEDGPNYDYEKMFDDTLYMGRCYRLFAFLADVRNGRGFAGCDTGDAVEPIWEPRGVPDDASPEYEQAVSDWGGDGHSHSFFTGEELRDADWDQETVERGYITFTDYPRFKEQGNMDNMGSCGDVSGGAIVKITPEQADELLVDASKMVEGKQYYVKAEYTAPLKVELAYYHDTWLPSVLALHEDPSKVRVCFFFDN